MKYFVAAVLMLVALDSVADSIRDKTIAMNCDFGAGRRCTPQDFRTPTGGVASRHGRLMAGVEVPVPHVEIPVPAIDADVGVRAVL